MGGMRLLVLIVAIINFTLGLGFALFGVFVIASVGMMDPLVMAILLWAVLSGFCNLCVVYWVATEEEGGSVSGTGVDDWSARVRLERRLIEIEKKLGLGAQAHELPRTQKDLVEPARAPELSPTELKLVEKFREKGFIYPEKVLEGFIQGKMGLGKTREQAIKEVDEENT